jgi:hypothetical protein
MPCSYDPAPAPSQYSVAARAAALEIDASESVPLLAEGEELAEKRGPGELAGRTLKDESQTITPRALLALRPPSGHPGGCDPRLGRMKNIARQKY